MENARHILEQGTDQNRADCAAALEEMEPAFAEFIDENNEAHHARTVTGDIPPEAVVDRASTDAIILRDTEKHRANAAKEERLIEEEKTKQKKLDLDMELRMKKEDEKTARSAAVQASLTSRKTEGRKETEAKATQKQAETEAKELTKRTETEAKELTKRTIELTKQKEMELQMLMIKNDITKAPKVVFDCPRAPKKRSQLAKDNSSKRIKVVTE